MNVRFGDIITFILQELKSSVIRVQTKSPRVSASIMLSEAE
jgi:hypothetical protein